MFNNPSFNKQLARKVVKLFTPGGIYEESAWFSFEHQATIQATSLGPDDYIEFDVLHINGGEWPQYCNCELSPGEMPHVDSFSTLTCPTCNSDGTRATIKLTASAPVVVLNSPQHAAIRARYVGENIEAINVWATLETNADNSEMFNGCGEVCIIQKTRTGNVRCNVEEGTQEYELIDSFGNITWDDPEPLQWEMTGRVDFADEDNPSLDNVKAEYVDPCGDIKWEVTQFQWTPTSEFVCVDFTEDSDEYNVLRKYKNEYGAELWYKDAVEQWADTGLKRCENNVIEKQQVTICGGIRWKSTEVSCGYIATYELDSGGKAFRPGQQDPEATVALEDCDGEVIAYIYPEPRKGATVPVIEGCEECPTGGMVLGYAVDNDSKTIVLPKNSGVQIMRGTIDAMPGLVVNKMPKIEIANFPEPEVFDGIIKYLPDLTIGNLETIKVEVESLPPFVINTFEKDGQLYKLYTDGTYEKLNVVESDRLVRVLYMLNNMPSAGNAPVDLTQYKVGSIARLLPWQNELPDGLRLKGYSLTADGAEIIKAGARLNLVDNTYVYAIWSIAVIYTSGTDDLVLGMPNDTWHDYNDQVRISHEIPTRNGYRFSGWITSRGDNRRPGDMLRITAPIVLRAKWSAE